MILLVLKDIKEFLPGFKKNTDDLLKNEKELKRKRIDDSENSQKLSIPLKKLCPPSRFIYKTGTFKQATDIKLVSFLF